MHSINQLFANVLGHLATARAARLFVSPPELKLAWEAFVAKGTQSVDIDEDTVAQKADIDEDSVVQNAGIDGDSAVLLVFPALHTGSDSHTNLRWWLNSSKRTAKKSLRRD